MVHTADPHTLVPQNPHNLRSTNAVTMNDPGLEEPLNETQNRLEEETKEEEELEQEAEQAFLNPRSYTQ